MYIVYYHCGEDEIYFYNTLKEIEEHFPDYINDKYFVGIYKIDKIIYQR